jgi:anti-anti-sigma factor
MSIQNWSKDMIVVNLPPSSQDHRELETAIAMAREKGDFNLVVDFSSVDVVGSRMFAALLELRQLLQESGHKLVLCGLSPATKGVFSIARLDDVFEFVQDRFAALADHQIVA